MPYSHLMKILRIIARLNVGGPARHVVWLTSGLQNDEFSSYLVTGTVPPGEEDMSYLADECGVEPITIAEMSRELSYKDAASLLKVYREIKRIEPDIIHTHTAKAGTVGRTAAFLYKWLTPGTLVGRPRKIRTVHTFHGHVFHSYYGGLKTKIFLLIEKLLAKVATDRIIVITEQQLNEINGKFGVGKKERFKVIRLGIDLGQFNDRNIKREMFRREISAGDDEFIIGLAGRLTEIKNVPMFIRSAAAVKKDLESDGLKSRFIVIGDGHLRQELESEGKNAGLGNSLLFLGNRNDIDIVFAGLDAMALTSLNEGTPLSLIEAMASSLPVISTEVGGVIDLLGAELRKHDGFTIRQRGIGVNSEDIDGFSNGLLHLIKNNELRAELAADGRSFVEKEYSKERLIFDIADLYRNIT